MNLENLGVQEMNLTEAKEIDGGIIPLLALAVQVACYSAAGDIMLNFSSYANALDEKMNNC